MKKALLALAVIATCITAAFSSPASATPQKVNRSTATVAILIHVYWAPGTPVGSGVAVYCQAPYGTAKTYTNSQGIAGCIIPANQWVAVYGWWPESGCIRYYFGAYNQYGLALWVNTGNGQDVSIYNNYSQNFCG